jgi:signal transduction histidine kinase
LPGLLQNVFVDADRISQILINLVSNAVKFSERGAKLNVTLKAEKYRRINWDVFNPEDDEELEAFRMRFEEK